MSLLIGAVALAGPMLCARNAVASDAETSSIELGWEGPPSCPASDDIERDVRRFLGDAWPRTALPPVAARVSVRESADGHFDVSMVTSSGGETRERTLSTATCDEAHDLVAFLLALLIDPSARPPSPEKAAETPVEKPQPPSVPPPRPAVARPPAEKQPAARFIVALSGSGEVGTLPGGSVGGELRAGLLLSGFSLEARGAAWLPRHAESGTVPGASGKFSLFEAGAAACVRGAPWGEPALQACAGPVLLFMRGEGSGVRAPGRDDALFSAASAEAALLVALSSRLSLRPALGALVPFRRPTFSIRDVGSIHRPAAAAGRALLGFEVRF